MISKGSIMNNLSELSQLITDMKQTILHDHNGDTHLWYDSLSDSDKWIWVNLLSDMYDIIQLHEDSK